MVQTTAVLDLPEEACSPVPMTQRPLRYVAVKARQNGRSRTLAEA